MKYFFVLKGNRPYNQLGSISLRTYYTDTCKTKKEVRAKYSSKNIHGNTVKEVWKEDEYINIYGNESAAKIERWYLA